MDATQCELYKLASLGREHGLDRAVQWLMARMAEAERTRKRHKRKVKVRLERGGEFWVEERVLKEQAGRT